jgi:two-component system cell cycle sensor histidine kinase PleC
VSQRVITDTQATLALALEDPDLELCCDLVLVSRALGKLIENSTKFSPRGVRIVLGAAMTKTGELAFLVEDNGPGIAADKLATIVQPFAQSDLSTRRSKEGLGLGVPLVQAIATAHDAKFRIESSPGNGTRALLLMPQARMLTPRRASAQHAATG